MGHLKVDSENLYEKAETTNNMSFVVRANALRKGLSEKEQELCEVHDAIQKVETRIANL